VSDIPLTLAGYRNILVYYHRTSDEEYLGRCGSDEAVREHAIENNVEIVGRFYDGKTRHHTPIEKREGLSAALRALQLPHVSGLIVHRLDRISRDVGLMFEVGARVWDLNCDLYATDLGRIPRGKEGRETITYAAMRGRSELDAMKQRTSEALAAKARDGGYRGGPRFYGRPYGRCKQGSNWVPVPEEQGVIERIIAACSDGRGYQAMADQLNREGVPTVSGTPWSRQMVQKLVRDQRKTLARLTPIVNSADAPLTSLQTPYIPESGVSLLVTNSALSS